MGRRTSRKSALLLMMDGLAIVFIILSHQLARYSEAVDTQISQLAQFSDHFFAGFGLSLFTFSSGYKLMMNHASDVGDRGFLRRYFTKRFMRLYRPYVGYTLLSLIQLISALVIVLYVWSPGERYADQLEGYVSGFRQPVSVVFIQFLIGVNPAAYHLWYLLALIAITAISFSVLVFASRDALFLMSAPLIVLNLVFLDDGMFVSPLVDGILRYLPLFIIGGFVGHMYQTQNRRYMLILTGMSLVFAFVASMVTLSVGATCAHITTMLFVLFPLPIVLLLTYVQRIRLIAALLTRVGETSFVAYLFHWPLVVPLLNLLLLDTLHLYVIITPFVIVAFVVLLSDVAIRFLRVVRMSFLLEDDPSLNTDAR